MFDHNQLDIAISHFHFLATIMDEIRSGIEVQAANIVSHIIALGTFNISAILTADSTIKCDVMAIMTILTTKVHRNLFHFSGLGMM